MPSTINADNGVSSGSAGLKSTADSSGVLSLQTNGTTAVTINTSQNVGIGTTSPGAFGALSVNGNVIVPNTAGVVFNTSFGNAPTTLISGSQSEDRLSFFTNTTERMRVDTSGNVGIGTTSPTALGAGRTSVNINGSTDSILWMMSNSATTGYIQGEAASFNVVAASNKNLITTAQGTGVISWITGGSERARIDSSGNLLVGTTGAGGNAGCSILPNFSSGAATIIFDRATTTNTSTPLYFRNAGTIVGTITYTNTATAYNTSSDYRLKNITGPITNSGAYIDSLNPVEGTWKADGAPFVGLIAHEVQEVSRTQVATGEKDGAEMQGMDYSSAEIIANLIAEVKSLRARMAQLEAKG